MHSKINPVYPVHPVRDCGNNREKYFYRPISFFQPYSISNGVHPVKKNKKKKFPYIKLTFTLLLFLFSFFLTSPALSASKKSSELEYLVKAGFIYNFTKFIKWPEEALSNKQTEFIIGVIGKNPFGKNLDKLATQKKVNGREIIIKNISLSDEPSEFHILFVSSSEKNNLEKIIARFDNSSALIIGDTPGFAKRGVGINFYVEKNKVRVEFNRNALKEAGLKVSSGLLNVGRIVK